MKVIIIVFENLKLLLNFPIKSWTFIYEFENPNIETSSIIKDL